MIKDSLFIGLIITLLIPYSLFGNIRQHKEIAPYLESLKNAENDSVKVMIYHDIIGTLLDEDVSLAKVYLDSAFTLAENIGHEKAIVRALKNQSIIHYYEGKYADAFNKLNEAYDLALDIQDDFEIANTALFLGLVHSEIGLKDRALADYSQCIQSFSKVNDSLGLVKVFNNLGVFYTHQNELDSALFYYKASIRIALAMGDESEVGLTYTNVANCLLEMGRIDSVNNYLLKSEPIIIGSGNLNDYITFNLVRGRYYLSREDTENALKYFHKSAEVAEDFKVIQERGESYLGLSEAYAMMGEYEKAYHFLIDHDKIEDSIASSDVTKLLIRDAFAAQYEKQKQIDDLLGQQRDKEIEEMLEREKTLRGILYVSVAIVLIISFLIYSNYRLKLTDNRELEKQKRLIEENNKRLEAALTENRNLTNMIVHDLKSPLNSIKSITELIKMHNQGEDTARYIEFMDRSIMGAETLIANLNFLNALGHGGMEVRKKKLNFRDLIQDRMDSFKQLADKKSITLQSEVSPEVNEIMSDKSMLTSIIDNLLSNAIKFSMIKKNVYIKAWMEGERLVWSVKDEGPGIMPAERHLLFGKFKKLSARPTGEETSTGLGLSIVKELVDKLGGRIEVESEVNDGAEFIVSLPSK